MKISYNWLKDYINPIPSVEETAEILTSIGLEVESIDPYESIKGGMKGIIIGEVLTYKKHPNADKLIITTVDLGDREPVQIICGAPNVAIGQKVPVATIGSTIFKGSESIPIIKTRIRGELSEGMICAEDELGLGPSHEGIMVLDSSAVPGSPAHEYFNVITDVVFEIGLTPNRIDAASHYGVARDLAAYLSKYQYINIKKPSIDSFKVDTRNSIIPVEISDKSGCIRYSGLTISGIIVKESPDWLKNKLKAVGLNPINIIVDITNYVLYESGQPLHAFDADKITGKKVIVRTIPQGTRFIALDGQDLELSDEDLMICNIEEGMAIAGIFGGYNSGVKNETKNIFLESACFNPHYIRKTSKRHLLYTDSSFRFERGSDPNFTIDALKRAAILIKELAGGEISSDIIDVYPVKVEDFKVNLTYRNLDRLIGQKIERDRVKSILQSLDIKVISTQESGLSLEIPTYRVDVKREADVIEEIARIFGYNNIEMSNTLHASISHTDKPDKENIGNIISDMLSSNGFLEIMSNSLTRSKYYESENNENETLVRIYNPLSSDLNCLRQTLLFGGLEAVLMNENHKNFNLRFYEFGNIYLKLRKEIKNPLDKYFEEERLALLLSGKKNDENWNTPAGLTNFYLLKAYTELVLNRLGFKMDDIVVKSTINPNISEGLDYFSKGKPLVSFGKVEKKLIRSFDIKNEVFYAEFRWTIILKEIPNHKTSFTELPRYPEVKRDLSMILEKTVTFEQVKNVSLKAEKKLLKGIVLFDVYEGEKIEKGSKSYAVSFTLRDDSKTLTDKEIDKIMNKISSQLEEELGAHIRS